MTFSIVAMICVAGMSHSDCAPVPGYSRDVAIIGEASNEIECGIQAQQADSLDKDFAELAWATGDILFPCEAWSFNYGPPSSPPPDDPPPCVDCDPPPPCVMCGPPPTAVPEPATYVMLLAGFVGICFFGRRRRA